MTPPRLPRWLMGLFVARDDRHDVLANIDDLFVHRLQHSGRLQATAWYWWQTLTIGARLRFQRSNHHIRSPRTLRLRIAAFRDDIRFTIRTLRARPAFTLAAVITLALGFTGSTVIYTVVHATLLSPPSYPAPEQLMWAWPTADEPLSLQRFTDLQPAVGETIQLTAFAGRRYSLLGGDNAAEVQGIAVTTNHFEVFGKPPILGRAFRPEDAWPSARPVVVLSYETWMQQFAGDPNVIGRTVDLFTSASIPMVSGAFSGTPHTVVGVAPPRYQPFGFDVQAITPLVADPTVPSFQNMSELSVVGRMRDGVTVDQAITVVGSAMITLETLNDGEVATIGAALFVPLQEALVGHLRESMLLALAGVGVVVLIACANVGNLLLVHTANRQDELVIRRALGASGSRIASQMFTESFVLSCLALGLGTLAAMGALPIALRVIPHELAPTHDVSVWGWPMVFNGGLLLFATLACGMAPVVQFARPRGQSSNIVRSAVGATRHGNRLNSTLVVFEVTLALVLVYGAGLLVTSFSQLTREDAGFSTDGIATVRLAPASSDYASAEVRRAFYDRVLEGVRSLPDVQTAGAIHFLPIADGGPSIFFQRDLSGNSEREAASYRVITPGYLETMGIPLVRGRTVSDADVAGAPLVGLVNEALAAHLWPGDEAIGKTLYRTSGATWFTVIGVVGNVRQQGLGLPPDPEVYLPLQQSSWASAMTLVMKSNTPTTQLSGSLSRIVREIDPNVPVTRVATMKDVLGSSVASPRFYSILFSLFGVLALLLSAVGIYGVIAYLVNKRASEIGLRMALGATQTGIVRSEMIRGARLAATGILLGIGLSAVASRWLESMLYGVQPLHTGVFAATTGILATVAFMAILLPVWRASRIDPVRALRDS